MKITNQRLTGLGITAFILVILTTVLYLPKNEKGRDVREGSLLIQGLDMSQIAKVTVKSSDGLVTLGRENDLFLIAERGGYPASMEKLNKLIIECLDVRCDKKISGKKDSHKDLGVTEDAEDAVVVRFFDEKGKELVGLVAGKSAEKASGIYVRLLGEDTVYTSKDSLQLDKRPTDFMDTDLVKLDAKEVTKVSVRTPESSYMLSKKDDKVVLDSVPPKKKVKQSDLDSVFEALTTSVYFTDVAKADGLKVEWKNMYTCRLKNLITYAVQLAKKEDKHYIRIQAIPATQQELEAHVIAVGQDSEKGREATDKFLVARDKANEFTKQHAPWAYEISSWSAGKMMKPKKDLVEEPPIAASHILIGYKGSDKSTATRTKAEAKKLAGELLAKAKAKDADFAKLAKESSEGPSKDKGGDLGEFAKGTMHENFDKAARKLKVGEISGVVETPFGFHIIKRTK